MPFSSLGLIDPLVSAVEREGYTQPSPIQAQAIPAVLAGNDVLAAAQTGTGKTAGFALPILQRLSQTPAPQGQYARALVLTPTRELAAQVADSFKRYGEGLRLSTRVVFGGVSINPQMMGLRRGTDILVATPGRLLDLTARRAIDLSKIDVLVLDEADRMLDMGFIHDIRKVLKMLPTKRQNLMFSATFSGEIRTLAATIVRNPVELSVTPKNSTAERVEQLVHPVDKKQKPSLLRHLIVTHEWQQVLVFSRTKHGANRLATQLENWDINAAAIHGNKSQGARTKALAGFKDKSIRVLVATDIAARGLDIDKLPQVVNVDLPNVPEDYVHRIGRTGRAGASGKAVSLVSADEAKQLFDIEKLIKTKLDRELVDGFEPVHDVPTDPKKLPKGPPAAARSASGRSSGRPANRSGAAAGKPGAPRRRRPSGGGGSGGSRAPQRAGSRGR